jgi:cytochrome c556
MLRKMLVVAALLTLGTTAAFAQSCQDVINHRQSLMKRSGSMAKIAVAMVKGETPFDLAKTKEIFAAFANDAEKMPTLFPECSQKGDDTTAAMTIWQRPADFKAAMAKFKADVKAAQENTKDLDTFKASFKPIGQDCGSCHQRFRVRKS